MSATDGPPGSFPDGLRNNLVRRIISAFISSFEGGVLLLPEVLGGSSYVDRRRRSSSFSFSFFLSVCSKRLDFLELSLTRPVNLTDGHILRIDGPLHRLYLRRQASKRICYVVNLLFHRYKDTKSI